MNAIIWKNTGINTENIPDTPTRLETWGDVIKTPVLDTTQSRVLNSISIKTTWAQIKDSDYVKVDDFYYFVRNLTMTSYDVCRIELTPDYLTSAGGAAALDYMDGITTRAHVAKAEDTFGKFLQPDPLTTPAEPLILETSEEFLTPSDSQFHFVESSLDLYEMGAGGATTATTYTDAVSGETVTVPTPPPVLKTTRFRLGTTNERAETETLGTCVFDGDDLTVQRGIQEARNLGVEDGIIAAWSIPTSMVTVTKYTEEGVELPYISRITDNSQIPLIPSDISGYEYAVVHNKRALYGESSRYGMLSASGNRTEYSPEDVYLTGATGPGVISRFDARADGSPYYNFSAIHGQLVDTNSKFFNMACQCQKWRTLPIRFTTERGGILNTMEYNASRTQQETAWEHVGTRYSRAQQRGILNTVGGVGQAIFSILGGDIAGAAKGAGGLASGYLDAAERFDEYMEAREEQSAARSAAVLSRARDAAVITPEVHFPYDNPSVRDYVGNGVLVYRYRLSPGDLERIDKLLTMYGYAVTKNLERSDFNSRSNFNFVQAAGVGVVGNSGGYLPRWWTDGISAQLSGGVRVWHVKPSPAYYDESINPNN